MKNAITVRIGLAIYRKERSPFWYARLWNPVSRRYSVKSTKEKSRIQAREAAIEWAETIDHIAIETAKAERKIHFEVFAKMLPKTNTDDWKKLNRRGDGILDVFGLMPVTKIKTTDLRSYIDTLKGRGLAVTTQKKHLYTIRKVLRYAIEDGVINAIPDSPKIDKVSDNPRPSFTFNEYCHFIGTIHDCFGDVGKLLSGKRVVRTDEIRMEHRIAFDFIKYSFLRPTEGELFGIKYKDVTRVEYPNKRLDIIVRKGKTGRRIVHSLEFAVELFDELVKVNPDHLQDDYLFLNEYPNRTTAVRKMGQIFAYVAVKADLREDGEGNKRTVYSFRHHCIQNRIRESKGKVNLLTLAKMCGTSVEVIDRFYASKMELNEGIIENLRSFGE